MGNWYQLEDWFNVVKDKLFRIRIYRRAGDWTPYELAHPEEVPSQYVDGSPFLLCKIEDAVVLPDGDILLGIRYIDVETNEPDVFKEYNKLSNINLVQVDGDNDEVIEDD